MLLADRGTVGELFEQILGGDGFVGVNSTNCVGEHASYAENCDFLAIFGEGD